MMWFVKGLRACPAKAGCDYGEVDDVDFSVQIEICSWVYTCGNTLSEITRNHCHVEDVCEAVTVNVTALLQRLEHSERKASRVGCWA